MESAPDDGTQGGDASAPGAGGAEPAPDAAAGQDPGAPQEGEWGGWRARRLGRLPYSRWGEWRRRYGYPYPNY